MNFKTLATGAALALGLAASGAHAQTAQSSVNYDFIHGFFTVTDDGPSVLNVNAGQLVTVSGNWSVTDTDDSYCAFCVIQLYAAGLPGLPTQANLYSNVISGGDSSSGNYSMTFNAPTVAGSYFIGGTTSLDYQFNTVSGGANGDGFVNYQINVAGVPEPATWAMMLVGFGGLGAVLRNRRRSVAVIVA